MASLTGAIANSLAPGLALSSGIIFANSLLTRTSVVSSRVRDLNKEARALRASSPVNEARLACIRLQVDLLLRRARIIQRAVLCSFAGVVCFITTILELLLFGFINVGADTAVAPVTFAAGLVSVGAAMLLSFSEMTLSSDTLEMDIESSLGPDSLPPPPDRRGRGGSERER